MQLSKNQWKQLLNNADTSGHTNDLIAKAVAKAGSILKLQQATGLDRYNITLWLQAKRTPTPASICRLYAYLEQDVT
jgi:hypothetical protein